MFYDFKSIVNSYIIRVNFIMDIYSLGLVTIMVK